MLFRLAVLSNGEEIIMRRRRFLRLGVAGTALTLGGWLAGKRAEPDPWAEDSLPSPAYSVTPVVGDGKWIWNKPPEGSTGYLDPRAYSVKVGIELCGRGDATRLVATTTLPVECPEQKLADEQIKTEGCQAETRQIGPLARQLVLHAAQIAAGQTVTAWWQAKVTLLKQYFHYQAEQFPEKQKVPGEVLRQYMGDSPGIQTRLPELQKLCAELRGEAQHPWEIARRFATWIPRNIRPQLGRYTSVQTALETRQGDCQEMSALFVALCRAAGIPARLVWVPNHNWSEFFLVDQEGAGHWIPAHTACYFWFGWTGAHELVLQKGDRLRVPERGSYFRLLEDWAQWSGKRPEVHYPADLTPLPATSGADPGPGARHKIETGEWKLTGTHPLDHYVRR